MTNAIHYQVKYGNVHVLTFVSIWTEMRGTQVYLTMVVIQVRTAVKQLCRASMYVTLTLP
jgi:hypothetical protein